MANYPDSFPGVKHTYKVVFHIIRDDNGERDGFVGEDVVMNVIRDLNTTFKTSDVYFKYGGFDYVDDSDLSGDILLFSLNNVFSNYANDNSAFHLIILNGKIVEYYDQNNNPVTVPGFGPNYGGISYYSFQGITSRRVPAHEIGHNLGLKHTFSDIENVIRETDAPGYNANYFGDRVHDTPACRIWGNNQFNSSGVYEGNDIDNNTALPATDVNRQYSSQHPRINNIMYVHEDGDLDIDYVLTPGQIKRIRHYISLDFSNGSFNYYNASVAWEELFKPFESRLVAGSAIASVTDNNDGTAEVCRSILRMDRFQKGFDMTFYEDEENNNVVFATSNSNELKEITSGIRNYYTNAQQVNLNHFELIQVPCYRGTICETEDYVGGVVISTQVLGSMNLTVKELSEIEVKDPDLFSKLMEQYYHILKKYTSSGAVDEKVIYKE